MDAMETEFRMFSRAHFAARAGVILALGLMCTSCNMLHKPDPMPIGLLAPYGNGHDVIWAVAPLRNESGTSLANELALADTLRNQLTEVKGISALPVNRTINAMRALKMSSVMTPGDARKLASALDVDAIVVGSVTSWQPYHPPQIGLNLVLFHNGGAMQDSAMLDPVAMTTASTAMSIDSGTGPISSVSIQLDGASNEVRCKVKQYAEGRHDPTSAMGAEKYLKSMSEFEKFACFQVTSLLLEHERNRLSPQVKQEQASAR